MLAIEFNNSFWTCAERVAAAADAGSPSDFSQMSRFCFVDQKKSRPQETRLSCLLYILIAVFQAHQWVLDNMDKWVEKYLIADNSLRIRNGKFLSLDNHDESLIIYQPLSRKYRATWLRLSPPTKKTTNKQKDAAVIMK